MQQRKERATSKREAEEPATEIKGGSDIDSSKFDALLDEIDDLLGTDEEGQALVSGFVQQPGQ